MSHLNRREFSIAVGLGTAVSYSRILGANDRARLNTPALCLFSKHLPDLGYDDLGRQSKEFGFDGVDLTVRPKGHVLPENAARDLPRAVETRGPRSSGGRGVGKGGVGSGVID